MADAPRLAQLARDLGWEVDPTGGPQGAVLARTDGRELFLRPEPTGGVTLEAPVRRVSSPPPGALYPLLVRWASPRPGIKAITCPAADGTTVVVRREGVSALRDALSTSAAGLVVERDALEAELQRDEPTWSHSPGLAHGSPGRAGPVAGRVAARRSDRFVPVGETDGADRRPCPRCGESIKQVALKCRHCGEVFDAALAATRHAVDASRGFGLATPLQRLQAQLIDAAFESFPPLAVVGLCLLQLNTKAQRAEELIPQAVAVLGPLAVALTLLGVYVVQWLFISHFAATVGKAWMGIRIERLDGRPVGFVTGVVLRNWARNLLTAPPYAGFVFGLTDVLMIFGDERRCLHDRMAQTRVIDLAGRTSHCDRCDRATAISPRGRCNGCGEFVLASLDTQALASLDHSLETCKRWLGYAVVAFLGSWGAFLVKVGGPGLFIGASFLLLAIVFVLRQLAGRFML